VGREHPIARGRGDHPEALARNVNTVDTAKAPIAEAARGEAGGGSVLDHRFGFFFRNF
jgi:hypothetical protein